MPHHVTQRGNRRQPTFFNDGDHAAYLERMAQSCGERGVEIWSYCRMPNHIHLVAVPSTKDALRWAIGAAYERCTRRISFREKWRGYLWQGRFASFVMDEAYLLAAARYVELNPVWARLAGTPSEWRWSSARAHLSGHDDCLVKAAPLLAMIGDWSAFLASAVPEEELRDLRRHGGTGQPLGDETFVERLEKTVGRVLKLQKRGPKPIRLNPTCLRHANSWSGEDGSPGWRTSQTSARS
jgi:putative transposase